MECTESALGEFGEIEFYAKRGAPTQFDMCDGAQMPPRISCHCCCDASASQRDKHLYIYLYVYLYIRTPENSFHSLTISIKQVILIHRSLMCLSVYMLTVHLASVSSEGCGMKYAPSAETIHLDQIDARTYNYSNFRKVWMWMCV